MYSSDGFCKFTGFTRAEVMKKNCDCSFLYGQQTDPETIRELHNALQTKTAIQKEFIAYKKDGKSAFTSAKGLYPNIGTLAYKILILRRRLT